MEEQEKALYQTILALSIPDLRNELEHNNLPTTGTRTTCIQRLFKYKRQQLAKESVPKSSKPKRIIRQTARAQDKAERTTLQHSETERLSQTTSQNSEAAPSQSDAPQDPIQTFVEEQTPPKKTLDHEVKRSEEYPTQDFEQRVEKLLDERLAVQLGEWQEKFLQTLAESQLTFMKSPAQKIPIVEDKGQPVESSTPFKRVNPYENIEVTQLVRRKRFLATSIGVVIREVQRLIDGDRTHKQLSKTLERLNSLEKEYSGLVQELIAILPSEEVVMDEVNSWAVFQQEILEITMLAEQQISVQLETEESKKQLSTAEHSNPVSSNLRLPKFTLSEFTGNIIQWVSWWDQYKMCIHENETLTDRDRFNYLRMYVKGTARRAIEYIEVSGDNYPKAIEALQRRYGRKRLIIEHLVESLLNIEKNEKVEARSLRSLYDVMVSRYRTLESYEPKLVEAQRILVPILQSKLPDEIRRKWEFQLSKFESEEDDKQVTVEYFFGFLRSHVMSEEAMEKSTFKQKGMPSKGPKGQRRKDGAFRYGGKDRREEGYRENEQLPFSATALNADSKGKETFKASGRPQCANCGKGHHVANCFLFERRSLDDRLQLAKDKGLCFNCLEPTSPSHYSIVCRYPGCPKEGCKRKHHFLLHRNTSTGIKDLENQEKDKDTNEDEFTARTGVASGFLSTSLDNQVMLLPTAMVNLVSRDTIVPVRVLVDSGSDQSYIREEIVQSLGMETKGAAKTMTILMHGGQARNTRVKRASFQLLARNQKTNIAFHAWSVPTVCSPPERAAVNLERYPHLKGLPLADTDPRSGATIDILLGADQWSRIMKGGIRKGSPSSPMALNSVFGWLLSGPTGVEQPHSCKASTHHATTKILEDDSNLLLKKFWDLESIGIIEEKMGPSVEEEYVVQQFKDKVKFDGQRYEVSLPWKKNCPKLTSNREISLKRLTKVEARLKKQPEQAQMYRDSINQYFNDGHARLLTVEDEQASKIHYLPHHPVFRKEKSTTKCRAVFDAATKTPEGVSLNDCLLPGPALQPDLVSLLIRFRFHRIGMMADLRKMFLQIKIAPEDQNVHRFLWRDLDSNAEVKEYCMTRLPFGDICSPYEAIATMHHHADQCKEVYPRAAQVIKEDTYVDDCLTGCETEIMATELYSDLVEMMKIGGFDLLKWATNSKVVLENIPPNQRAVSRVVCLDNYSNPLKALGLSWDTIEDVFFFRQGDKLLQAPDPETKRSIISISSKLFDPLGFLNPYTIRAKIIYQKLWIRGASWDDSLEEEIRNEWRKWKEQLAHLNLIRISRPLVTSLDLEIANIQLHGYSDASPNAYGAVTYLRIEERTGNVRVQILFAKTRVAPTRRITLPRLELMAAYLLAKMTAFLLKTLGEKVEQYTCWSDSTITLSWIHRPSCDWKVFVANRVQEIQEKTDPERWRFCPGDTNPADLVTRGESLKMLTKNSLWWNGPQWLRKPAEEWPRNLVNEDLSECPERKEKVHCNIAVSTFPSSCIDPERFERWTKIVRITALVLKAAGLFKRLREKDEETRNNNLSPEITAEQLKEARIYWYQEIQKANFAEEWSSLEKRKGLPFKSPLRKLNPYFDEKDKLIRVGGRLQFSELPEETKHQIILPAKHPVVDKIIAHTHEIQALHAGPETTLAILREKFWILRGRRL